MVQKSQKKLIALLLLVVCFGFFSWFSLDTKLFPHIFKKLNRSNMFKITMPPSKFNDLIPLDQRLSPEQAGFIFDDPATYVGPILKGWPPNRDRNVSKLIRPGQNTILTGKTVHIVC